MAFSEFFAFFAALAPLRDFSDTLAALPSLHRNRFVAAFRNPSNNLRPRIILAQVC
jgi:hypothetical protein